MRYAHLIKPGDHADLPPRSNLRVVFVRTGWPNAAVMLFDGDEFVDTFDAGGPRRHEVGLHLPEGGRVVLYDDASVCVSFETHGEAEERHEKSDAPRWYQKHVKRRAESVAA
jgi:hypothetical protein